MDGPNTAYLESRIRDLENEVSRLTHTVHDLQKKLADKGWDYEYYREALERATRENY